LSRTDTADHALEAFARSEVEEVVLLGRRGPAQAAFTTSELRELGELDDVDVVVAPHEVVLDPLSQAFLELAEPTARRNVDLLREYARRGARGRRKRIELRFCVSPVRIVGGDRVEGVHVVRNELAGSDGGGLVATPTGETDLIEAQLVFRSIGYRGTPVPGLPFDERRGTLANDGGRVIDRDTGRPMAGVYAAGWIKRGPSGIIGTNKKCANETVALMLEDLANGLLPGPTVDPGTLLDALAQRRVDVVTYDGWKRVDEFERARGRAAGRPRVKLVRHADLLEHAGVASPRTANGLIDGPADDALRAGPSTVNSVPG
jgi:ferredoxin--NADP+ reductase